MRIRFTILLALVANLCYATDTSDIECESYADNRFKGICIELPNYREIRGGTKIRTTYAKECPEELIGAFDYAVKIWEENLPSMLPLNITAQRKNRHIGFTTRLLYSFIKKMEIKSQIISFQNKSTKLIL